MLRNRFCFLKKRVNRVFFDAEHFFDGYKANPEYALKVLEHAVNGGAECAVLCDTNGGALPFEIEDIVAAVKNGFLFLLEFTPIMIVRSRWQTVLPP